MGKMKDLFIDLQNQFGLNLENMPEDFSMENYVAERAKEIENSKK